MVAAHRQLRLMLWGGFGNQMHWTWTSCRCKRILHNPLRSKLNTMPGMQHLSVFLRSDGRCETGTAYLTYLTSPASTLSARQLLDMPLSSRRVP